MFYRQVPKSIPDNLAFRRDLIRECQKSPKLAEEVRLACGRDLLFWVNSFAFTYDPRKSEGNRVVPFVTYAYQDDALLEMQQALGVEDALIEKSRDMGASWMILLVFAHAWQFKGNCTFGLISSSEALVDSPGNPKSLFWKLDLLLKNQPAFLLPKFLRQKLHLRNLETDSTIDGFTTTGDVMRGDRRTAALVDEFAAFEAGDGYKVLSATQHATNSRFFNSTPQGASGAFYDMAHSEIRKIRLHWSQHPEKSIGLYTDGQGKARSPWYDNECKRTPIPALIGQELDISYESSVTRLFPEELLNRLYPDCRPPYYQGRLDFDPANGTPVGFVEDVTDNLLLWCLLDDNRPPENERYSIGADIGMGVGATPSVLSVTDKRTGEKVAQFSSIHMRPDQFAELAVALCRWFNNAYLIWEKNGPGGQFGNRVLEVGYRELYWSKDEEGLAQSLSPGLKPGWQSSKVTKKLLLGEYLRGLASGTYINRSKPALKECEHYRVFPDTTVGSGKAKAAQDGSQAGDNHSDHVIADALSYKGCKDVQKPKVEEEWDQTPIGSFGWRRQQRNKARRLAKMW